MFSYDFNISLATVFAISISIEQEACILVDLAFSSTFLSFYALAPPDLSIYHRNFSFMLISNLIPGISMISRHQVQRLSYALLPPGI